MVSRFGNFGRIADPRSALDEAKQHGEKGEQPDGDKEDRDRNDRRLQTDESHPESLDSGDPRK